MLPRRSFPPPFGEVSARVAGCSPGAAGVYNRPSRGRLQMRTTLALLSMAVALTSASAPARAADDEAAPLGQSPAQRLALTTSRLTNEEHRFERWRWTWVATYAALGVGSL